MIGKLGRIIRIFQVIYLQPELILLIQKIKIKKQILARLLISIARKKDTISQLAKIIEGKILILVLSTSMLITSASKKVIIKQILFAFNI